MKSTLFAVALALTTTQSFACSLFEAQVIGKVISVRVEESNGVKNCYFKAVFSDFKPHALCPLDQVEAESFEILDSKCGYDLKEGQQVTGYLILARDNEQVILEQ